MKIKNFNEYSKLLEKKEEYPKTLILKGLDFGNNFNS